MFLSALKEFSSLFFQTYLKAIKKCQHSLNFFDESCIITNCIKQLTFNTFANDLKVVRSTYHAMSMYNLNNISFLGDMLEAWCIHGQF